MAIGVAPPTAHNLLRTLAARGYVAKSGRPVKYRLGPAVSQLADLHTQRAWFRRAGQMLRGLFEELGDATVTIAELLAAEVSIILRCSPEGAGPLERPQARHLHPYGSASSLAFQAFGPQEALSAYRRRYPFWEFGATRWQTPEALEEHLEVFRQQGYASPSQDDADAFLLAAPVFDASGEMIASIGASLSPSAQPHKRELAIDRVVRAAEALSAQSAHIQKERGDDPNADC